MGFWGGVGRFALTTGAALVGGAVGSVLIPGAGTVAGASLGVALGSALGGGGMEAGITLAQGGSVGQALTNGAQTGVLSLGGGLIGGAARGIRATMGGQNVLRRMLSGAFHPAVRNPNAGFRAAWGARGPSLNAARGWLTGSGAAAGFAGSRMGPDSQSQQSAIAKVPVRPAGRENRGSTDSPALVFP